MADALVATPGSNADGTKMPKDKNCPFCHAPFTSSSLGRHLDLYIKEKNAKPPDNIHHVEEIRRLRGNVTRRQARTSSAKREGSTPSSAKATPIPDQSSPASGLHYSNTGHAEGGPVRVNLNRPSWQATGVINDLPPVIRESPSYPKPHNTIRRSSAKEDIIRKQDALEEKERGRAAGLALKEVLDSVHAANQRAHPRPLLDTNFFRLSFPAICLQCLVPPPSFSANPTYVGPAHWPIETPGPAQFESLRLWLASKLKSWRRQRAAGPSNEIKHNGLNGHTNQQEPDPEGQEEEERYFRHLQNAYGEWSSLTAEERYNSWKVEFMKSYVQEQEKHKETAASLSKAEQEIQFLRAQLQRTTSQYPQTDSSYYQPSTLSLSPETAVALSDTANLKDWDFDALLTKHQSRLQSFRTTQTPLPTTPAKWLPRSHHNNDIPLTNGTSPYPPPPSHRPHNDAEHDSPGNSNEDIDLADAPGDEDDQQQGEMDRGMLDPDLRDKDTLAKAGGEGGGRGEYAGGRMLMGLREYEGIGLGNGGGERGGGM